MFSFWVDLRSPESSHEQSQTSDGHYIVGLDSVVGQITVRNKIRLQLITVKLYFTSQLIIRLTLTTELVSLNIN